MRRILGILALGGLVSFAPAAFAATSNVIFNGNIAATCVLTVGTDGTMTVDSTLQNLSSKNAGGQAGTVGLATTGGVNLSVDSAVVATKPAADTTPIAWSPVFSTTGSHVLAEGSATQALATPGIDTVRVNITGTKTGSNTFVVGAYRATVTVRCEPGA